MPTPTFPSGLALASDPQLSLLAIRLFKNTPPVGGFTALAQIVEASYPGYQSSRPEDWFPAEVLTEKWVRRRSQLVDFRSNAAAAGEVVRGIYVTMMVSGSVVLLYWRDFAADIDFSVPNSNQVIQEKIDCYDVSPLTP